MTLSTKHKQLSLLVAMHTTPHIMTSTNKKVPNNGHRVSTNPGDEVEERA